MVNSLSVLLLTKYTDIFVEKMREAFPLQKLLTFSTKILDYVDIQTGR